MDVEYYYKQKAGVIYLFIYHFLFVFSKCAVSVFVCVFPGSSYLRLKHFNVMKLVVEECGCMEWWVEKKNDFFIRLF